MHLIVFDRHNHYSWTKAGQPTAIKTARDAIANHQPIPIPPATRDKLNAIIVEADKRLVAKSK